jgi:hypothetical protein
MKKHDVYLKIRSQTAARTEPSLPFSNLSQKHHENIILLAKSLDPDVQSDAWAFLHQEISSGIPGLASAIAMRVLMYESNEQAENASNPAFYILLEETAPFSSEAKIVFQWMKRYLQKERKDIAADNNVQHQFARPIV